MEKQLPFRLSIQPGLSAAAAALAVELSQLIGFHSVSLCFPLIQPEHADNSASYQLSIEPAASGCTLRQQAGRVRLLVGPDADCGAVYRRFVREFDLLFPGYADNPRAEKKADFASASRQARPLPPFDERPVRGLESLFELNYILQDTDHDLLPDRLTARLLLPAHPSPAQLSAACDLAARFGLETLGLSYPFVLFSDDQRSDLIVLEQAQEESLSYCHQQGRRLFTLRGRDPQIADFTAKFCTEFPLAPAAPTGRLLAVTERLRESLTMRDLDGQLAWLESLAATAGQEERCCFFSPAVLSHTEELQQRYPGTVFRSYQEPTEIARRRFDLPWEADTLRQLFNRQVLPLIRPGDEVQLEAALSEDAPFRQGLAAELAQAVAQRGGRLMSSVIVCAYKPGLSWLSEYVAPRLDAANLGRLVIRFRPLLTAGQQDWANTAGATPSYHLEPSGEQAAALDPPLRPMMELYPCDDILAQQLQISRDRIIFEEYQGSEDLTYQVVAQDNQGRELLRDVWRNRYRQRFLLDQFPQAGSVQSNTGWLKATINGRTVVDLCFKTDQETIWDCFQQEVLPYFGALVHQRAGGRPHPSQQPYFSQLVLEASASEPEYQLNFRQGIISSLCGLSEDFYFVGLEYFKLLGRISGDGELDAPGLILPIVKAVPGPPSFSFCHQDQAAPGPMIRRGGQELHPPLGPRDLSLHISQVRAGDDGLELVFDIQSDLLPAAQVSALARVISAGLGEVHQLLSGYSRVSFRFCGQVYTASPPPSPPAKSVAISQIDLKEGQVIGYEDYLKIIDQLKLVERLRVFKAGQSYLGREIYGIELRSSRPGYTSLTKQLNRNPSLYINNRHHANEVSSTNAAFVLLRQLLSDPQLTRLDDRLNLVIVPLENPDGAAVHHRLQADNPQWTLHCARYSGIGREFYHEHFREDTIHVEAHALTRLWRKWLPDVVTDNHGVAKNEWDEQFFGYIHPSYRGFWLPRSLLYGYFWCVADQEFSMNIPLNQVYQDAVADVVQADEEISALNREWQDRFEKYAHRWMPKMFPAEYYRDMINYWIYYPHDPAHRYTSVRFPWITTVNFTSEIADEGAQGEYLRLCGRTHALHCRAAIDLLLRARCVYDNSCVEEDDGSLTLRQVRQRPLLIPAVDEK